jgi:hypothetical protein
VDNDLTHHSSQVHFDRDVSDNPENENGHRISEPFCSSTYSAFKRGNVVRKEFDC